MFDSLFGMMSLLDMRKTCLCFVDVSPPRLLRLTGSYEK